MDEILDQVKRRGIKAYFECQIRIPSWLHGCMWVVGGYLRSDRPKDIDCAVDTNLPIDHLNGCDNFLGGQHIPSETGKVSSLSIDLWSLQDRGGLERYLITVPLNIQSVAYSPVVNRVVERGYVQCLKTKTLDLNDEATILIPAWEFVDKVQRICLETGFRLSERLQEYISQAPSNPNPQSSTVSGPARSGPSRRRRVHLPSF